MSKIINYKTLSASYPDELDVKVNEAINEGWQPHGYQFFQSAFHSTDGKDKNEGSHKTKKLTRMIPQSK
ncbi:DUF1737 domain-containing protein [Fodinibius sp.]|uniref:DUF1737 domain-containing protein n=1 Tax=Fodinibius sp. TaxID=1872440 RepID=UPI002ACE0D0F|nr:DUF1737 domain-containing protein [Fodinibius sp.]MDZ7658005.1 DUF1737 domain-containing protein [Fodinibius sp.]